MLFPTFVGMMSLYRVASLCPTIPPTTSVEYRCARAFSAVAIAKDSRQPRANPPGNVLGNVLPGSFIHKTALNSNGKTTTR
jgi:hypothetical protein